MQNFYAPVQIRYPPLGENIFVSRSGGIGRHKGLKIPRFVKTVTVQVRPPVVFLCSSDSNAFSPSPICRLVLLEQFFLMQFSHYCSNASRFWISFFRKLVFLKNFY